jgi:hypothetical protein
MNGYTRPLIAGLAVGIVFIVLFAILPIPVYSILPERMFPRQQDADYTPLLQLRILGLRESYVVGEGVDFSVRQVAGGACVLPESITIKDSSTGKIVREWNGTSTLTFCGPVALNPATSGMTWTTKGSEEKPVIFNQTGSYAVVAKHLFMTVQQEFKVVAIEDGNDTSPEVVSALLTKSSKSEVVKALLQKYPDADVTATANFHSELFNEFARYDPYGIVQYTVVDTDSDKDRTLMLSLIFDKYYENNTTPLVHLVCSGDNYSSTSVAKAFLPPSEIENC